MASHLRFLKNSATIADPSPQDAGVGGSGVVAPGRSSSGTAARRWPSDPTPVTANR